jgi:hypothetical protein
VQTPLFTDRARLPFALVWFLGNVVSVLLPTYLVPWVSGRFSWCSRQAQTRGASMPPERPCACAVRRDGAGVLAPVLSHRVQACVVSV